MQKWLCASLVGCLLAANFPEAFCFCAAAAAGAGSSTAACPRCCAGRTRPGPVQDQGSKPCCCDKAKSIRAVPPGPLADAPAPTFSGHVSPLAVAVASLPWAVCHLPELTKVAGPPGSAELSGRALPILLGHLLI